LASVELGDSGDGRARVLFSQDPLLGGMNSRLAPEHIAENQAAELVNVSLHDPTRPAKREGYTEIGAGAAGMAASDRRIARLTELDLGPATRLLVALVPGTDGGVYVTTSPSSDGWTRALLDGVTLDIGSDSVVTGRGHDALWIFPQSGRNAHALKPDGTIIDCGDENGSPPRDVVAFAYGLARGFAVVRNNVYFTKLFPSLEDLEEKTAFSRLTDFIPMEPGSGASYVAASWWRDDSLVVFGDRRIDRISVNAADPIDSTRHVVEQEFGCSAPNSVAAVGDSLYFLDQFLEFRELRQTIQANVAGVSPTPVSDPIRTELSESGRINSAAASKSFSVVHGERVLLFYPRDTSVDPDYVAVWNTRLRVWEGIWQLGHAMSSGVTSSIDGATKLYTSNGVSDDALSAVYRWGGVHSDAGLPVTYRETMRANIGKVPMQVWSPDDIAYAVHGDAGANCSVMLRTDHNDSLTRISEATVGSSPTSSFPLLSADFAVEAGDFPLTGGLPLVTTQRTQVWPKADMESQDGPLYQGIWPLYSMDHPLFDTGYGADPGPFLQVRVEETSTKAFERRSMTLVAQLIDEPASSSYSDNSYS